jgi:hypothetical protein
MATLYVDPASGWELPVDGGVITQGYGPENTDPSVRGLYRKGYHTGVDIGGVAENCPIKSPRDASVILAGPNAGYGNCVILECSDGLRLLFGHLFRIGVSVGDSVVRGQEIGGVGTTGVSTGVHLHYEYRHGDDDINPVPFLSPAAPVPTGLTATVKEDLNLRTGPTKNDPIITTLPAGTVVQVGQDGWLPVNFQGRQGWMYAEYLQVNTGPAASAAAARAPRAPVTKLPRKRPPRAKQP